MTTAERDPRLQRRPRGRSRGLWTRFTRRVRQGELGSLPVIIGLVVIWLYLLSCPNERFLTSGNLTNLMLQITAVGIDLGRASCWCCCWARSTCRSAPSAASRAAIMAVLNVKHGWVGWAAIAGGDRWSGPAIGLFQGSFVTLLPGARRSW